MNNIDLEKEIKRLVQSLRNEKGLVCAIDILIRLDYLSIKDYKDWRFGKVDYLEKVCKTNLTNLTLINKLISKHSTLLSLERSWTGYNRSGKGVKVKLQFSKSGNKLVEERYATHYLDKKRIKELKSIKACK